MKTAVLLLCLLPICLGIDCPNPPDVPVMDARTSKYTAALLFQVCKGQFHLGYKFTPLEQL